MSRWYPLDWPVGFPRSQERQSAKFKTGFDKALASTRRELRLLGATGIIVSTNLQTARDGWPDPRSKLKNNDPGVAVYWMLNGKMHSIACDQWDRVEDNLHAITLTLGADRGKARWGCSDVVGRAMNAYLSLPAPPKPRHWTEVLDALPGYSLEIIESNYRRLLKSAHPDTGGTHNQMAELNRAIEEARKEKQDVA